MSIITLGSTNPNFSHVIAKNPNTIATSKQPFQRNLRKGKLYGWFPKADNSEFRLLFKDSELEASYNPSGDFEYLDTTRYSSSYLPVQVISEALSTAYKGHELDVAGFSAYVEFTIELPDRISNRLKLAPPVSVEITEISGVHKRVKVTGELVSQVLNIAQIICVLATMATDSSLMSMEKIVLFKYLKVLLNAGADYSLKQLFISRGISNPEVFDEAVERGLINTSDITFKFGNTQVQRLKAIKHELKMDRSGVAKTLVDLGCGELSHTYKLLDLYSDIISVDADADIQATNRRRLASRGVSGVTLLTEMITEETLKNELSSIVSEADVLVSEVLEHIPKEEASGVLKELLSTNAERIVATVPNREFNQFYGMAEGDIRHFDHKWEPTKSEWIEFVTTNTPTTRKVKFVDVGDVVKGIPCTLMAVFSSVKPE